MCNELRFYTCFRLFAEFQPKAQEQNPNNSFGICANRISLQFVLKNENKAETGTTQTLTHALILGAVQWQRKLALDMSMEAG
jgi:hypothetical protein